MKKIMVFILLFLSIMFALKNRTFIYTRVINIEGNIILLENLNIPIKPNAVLYIIVKNEKGNTFAVKKIINPQFPLRYNITPNDIIFPELITFKTQLLSTLNYHAEIGNIKKGDLYSKTYNSSIFKKNMDIVIDNIK